ncbi:hypothetical protein LTR49_028060, partial [Elasticomyces elasticus]
GSGKSSLLKALSRRPGAMKCEAEAGFFINGVRADSRYIRQLSGYVDQDDALVGSLTVRETLDFSARLSLPKDIDTKQREERVQALLEHLGLKDQSESFIGTPIRRGISGGQKRRVSLAASIITGHEMFTGEPPNMDPTPDHPASLLVHRWPIQQMLGEPKTFRLRSLIESLEKDQFTSQYETKYIEGLHNSLEALEKLQGKTEKIKPDLSPIQPELLTRYLEQSRARATVIFEAVTLSLKSNSKMAEVTTVGQHPH